MSKVVSIRLPDDVIVWLNEASKLIGKSVTGMAQDIVITNYANTKSSSYSDLINKIDSCQKTIERLERLNSELESKLKNGGRVVYKVTPNIKQTPVPVSSDKYPGTSRNTPCPCGSGKKYKKCCGAEVLENKPESDDCQPDPSEIPATIELTGKNKSRI
jgi:preprotein translocase subunit SecA